MAAPKHLKEQVLKLRAEGKTYNQIVAELNCAKGTVAYYCNSTSKPKALKINRDWRKKFRRELKTKAGGKCEICGYDKCLEALQFHHRDPEQKEFQISDAIKKNKRAEFEKEIAKCALLCGNCHVEVHFGYATLEEEVACAA